MMQKSLIRVSRYSSDTCALLSLKIQMLKPSSGIINPMSPSESVPNKSQTALQLLGSSLLVFPMPQHFKQHLLPRTWVRWKEMGIVHLPLLLTSNELLSGTVSLNGNCAPKLQYTAELNRDLSISKLWQWLCSSLSTMTNMGRRRICTQKWIPKAVQHRNDGETESAQSWVFGWKVRQPPRCPATPADAVSSSQGNMKPTEPSSEQAGQCSCHPKKPGGWGNTLLFSLNPICGIADLSDSPPSPPPWPKVRVNQWTFNKQVRMEQKSF